MVSYDYDRDDAEKTYEYMKYKRAQYTLGKSLYQAFIILNYRYCMWCCCSNVCQTHSEKLRTIQRSI